MKDNTLEFEGYKPFDVIAGSSAGGWSDREIAAEIIRHCVILSSDSGTAERLYRELAETSDDDIDIDGWTQELEDTAIDHLPPYCSLQWQDNELTVIPYIDDDLPRLDHHLDHYAAGPGVESTYEYLHINDHGNADLFIWNHNKQDFDLIWSLV